MVTVDSTANPVRMKRRGRGATHRKKRRNRLRSRSTRLVKAGRVDLTPCIVCGATDDLTIHHIPPIRPDRFVFLCKPCHVLAHKPVFRTLEVCVADGHFSILPRAVAPAKPPSTPPQAQTVTAGKHLHPRSQSATAGKQTVSTSNRTASTSKHSVNTSKHVVGTASHAAAPATRVATSPGKDSTHGQT